MIYVVRIDGDRKIASGDPLLAEGQNRVLRVGEHADVSGGCDPDPARPQSHEIIRSAVVGAHHHEV